jgi:arsenate reductase
MADPANVLSRSLEPPLHLPERHDAGHHLSQPSLRDLAQHPGDDPPERRGAGEVIEYLKTPPTKKKLKELIKAMGISPRALLRRKGTPYDELGLDDESLSDEQLIDAMVAHPILINRPIVVTPRGARLCRPSEIVLEILENPDIGAFSKEDGQAVASKRTKT